jgi:hypothetical protein
MPAPAAFAERTPGLNNDLQILGTMSYGNEQFTVCSGRDPALVADMTAMATQDPFMRRMVPNDSREPDGRFLSPKNFEDWYAKGRYLVSYRDEQGRLAGIVAHGESSLAKKARNIEAYCIGTDTPFQAPSDAVHTMAIRIPGAHRDKPKVEAEGMSFARRVLSVGQSLYVAKMAEQGVQVSSIWAETNRYQYDPATNARSENGALYLYQGVGYERVATYTNPDPANPEERVLIINRRLSPERAVGIGAALLQYQFAGAMGSRA